MIASQPLRRLYFTLLAFGLLLALARPAWAQTTPKRVPGPWLISLEEALQQAKASNRPILIEFSGSDWCAPCIKLRQEVFDQPDFLTWASTRLILLREDFPRLPQNLLSPEQTRANEAVKARYNPQGDFPLEVIISPDGKMLANSEGYRSGGPTAYIQLLRELLPSLPQ